jgi:hypothetical protein
MRRARRIDVVAGSQIEIQSMFQDSSTTPSGGRMGIHQYAVAASADPESLRLMLLSADPRILPYGECPMAMLGMSSLVGTRLPDLRERVLTDLAGVRGCTHLNDAVRALSSAAQLAKQSRAAS